MLVKMETSGGGGGVNTSMSEDIVSTTEAWTITTNNAMICVGRAIGDTGSSSVMYLGIIENGVYHERLNIGDARAYIVTYTNGVYSIKAPSGTSEPENRRYINAIWE